MSAIEIMKKERVTKKKLIVVFFGERITKIKFKLFMTNFSWRMIGRRWGIKSERESRNLPRKFCDNDFFCRLIVKA